MRTYRVSRLGDVRLTREQFERDPAFDIATYWEKAAAQFLQQIPVYPVVLQVQPGALPYFRQALDGRYEILEEGKMRWLLRVYYTVFEEARTSVLGLGTEVEVVEPAELLEAVLHQAEAIVQKARQKTDETEQ